MLGWLERLALRKINDARRGMGLSEEKAFWRGTPWDPDCCHIALPLQEMAIIDVRLGRMETRDQLAATAMDAAWQKPCRQTSDGVYVVGQPLSIMALIFLGDLGLWRPRKSTEKADSVPELGVGGD